MPGLAEVQHDTRVRQPGEEDAAGNKIHHKGLLGHILHWEHDSMNADTWDDLTETAGRDI